MKLHNELSKQVNLVNKAEKYQNERDSILADNKEFYNQVNNIIKTFALLKFQQCKG